MNQRATMALEHVCEEDVANETVQVQESREFDSRHPASLLMAGSVSHLVSYMQAIADRFTNSIQVASQELMIRIESSASTAYSTNHIQAARAEFDRKVTEAARCMDSQRQWLIDEIHHLDSHWYGKVLERVALTETELDRELSDIPDLTHDQSIDLAIVMRAIAAHSERKSYIKGLKLQIQDFAD